MNPVLENIQNRRSVRNFSDQPLTQEVLETILEAGNQAPSGSNAQAWRFVVIQDPQKRQRLATLALPHYRKWLAASSKEFQEMRRKVDETLSDPVYYSAPAIVFVTGQSQGSGIFDCPMVCQNMMLAARSLGVGSCWVYIGSLATSEQEVKAMLKLQGDERVYGPILLGYPKGEFPAAPAKKPAKVEWI